PLDWRAHREGARSLALHVRHAGEDALQLQGARAHSPGERSLGVGEVGYTHGDAHRDRDGSPGPPHGGTGRRSADHRLDRARLSRSPSSWPTPTRPGALLLSARKHRDEHDYSRSDYSVHDVAEDRIRRE